MRIQQNIHFYFILFMTISVGETFHTHRHTRDSEQKSLRSLENQQHLQILEMEFAPFFFYRDFIHLLFKLDQTFDSSRSLFDVLCHDKKKKTGTTPVFVKLTR